VALASWRQDLQEGEAVDVEHDNPRVRRLCISVDVENYSRWDAQDQKFAQDSLAELLDETCRDARIDRSTWSRQPAGDGELAMLPPGVDEGSVIGRFVRNLTVHLYRHNRRLNQHAAIRLRVAMHFGMTEVAGLGFAGQAPVHVARLRDCPQLRQVMKEHPDVDFALIISQQLYEDHVGHEYPDFQIGDFRPVRVEIPDKGFEAKAWVYLPPATLPRPLATATPEPKAPGTAEPSRRQPANGAEPGHSNPQHGAGGLQLSADRLEIGQLAMRDIVNSRRPHPHRGPA
jgi:hypothetical protein